MADLDRLEWFRDGFDPFTVGPDNVWDVVDFVHSRCPVAHGHDELGDFYVVGKYSDVLAVLQDWHTFGNQRDSRIGIPVVPLEMPPIDSNPPFQRHLREILNPHFSPQKMKEYEPGARAIVGAFIDGFPDGPFDLATAFFQPLPPTLTFRLLLGLESDELARARFWVDEALFGGNDHDVSDSFEALMAWLFDLAERRRRGEGSRGDMLDGLVTGTVEDRRPLTDREVAGALLILLEGGFVATTDASSTFLVRLAENPHLQALLRNDPTRLPAALEEHMRLVPPAPMLARTCMADAEIGGREIKAGDRVGYMVAAANRDPDEFERPNDFDLDRGRNRHLAFGGGVHRCIGSHFARMSLRVLFEELLARFDHIEIAPGETVEWIAKGPASWYNAQHIPVVLHRAVAPV